MKIMPKKLPKSLLVSVLALVLVGSAAAAFVWISNIRTTTVVVREIPVTLSGDFVASSYTHEETFQQFAFTVNDAPYAVGYIFIEFIATGPINPGDIEVSVAVQTDPSTYISTQAMPGYPTNTTDNNMVFVLGDTANDPIDFGAISTGALNVYITYNAAYTMDASIRLTSTPS
jgi:hypothetical protein